MSVLDDDEIVSALSTGASSSNAPSSHRTPIPSQKPVKVKKVKKVMHKPASAGVKVRKSVLKRPAASKLEKVQKRVARPKVPHGLITKTPARVQRVFRFMKVFVDTATSLQSRPTPWTETLLCQYDINMLG